eukprot:gnl/TRDRNA2_/TRDRNA2_167459_c0_seq1.p1 gnl/TRDRNA2_/TRDRNA2_167459_c0~~gnl/TRDRNA2_/TRDRNA2_167459_c0_seq1.p1  ORF type:complete len:298 (-),score=53.35 gnl/TRDRNA2_/TRDRNA2_167459_c0_seq1:159-1052(-)
MMLNGNCVPKGAKSIANLSRRIKEEKGLDDKIRSAVRVGLHWDTEVLGGTHRVVQVLCAGMPISSTKHTTLANEWAPFACVALEAAYEATLAIAAMLSLMRQARVTVYLTEVGGGTLGNRPKWIADAIQRALFNYCDAGLDVKLVHSAVMPLEIYERLEAELRRSAPAKRPSAMQRRASVREAVEKKPKPKMVRRDNTAYSRASNAAAISEAFRYFDLNGDGVVSRQELMSVLQELDAELFTPDNIDRLLAEADANGDGLIHYEEFFAWICNEDTAMVRLVLLAPEAELTFSDDEAE